MIPKTLRQPIALIRRGLRKLLIDPLRYRGAGGYDAERYWSDRFRHYRFSLRGSGHEGLTEEENEAAYEQAKSDLLQALSDLGVDLASADVLEVGPGSGAFTQLLAEQGVTSYRGLDITDVLFADLTRRFPSYRFERQDVTTAPISGDYDLILVIEVIQHIVDRDRFNRAFRHLLDALRPGGILVVGPVAVRPVGTRRRLFNVRVWTVDDLSRCCEGRSVEDLGGFRGGRLLAIR